MIPTANGIDYEFPGVPPEPHFGARGPSSRPRGAVRGTRRLLLRELGEPARQHRFTKVKGTIQDMKQSEFRSLPDVVPLEDITSGKGRDGSEELFRSYDKLIDLAYQNGSTTSNS